MKRTTNYTNTFIEVAKDCPVSEAGIPPIREKTKSAARIQYEMISENPYRYTSDDVLFEVYAQKKNIPHQNRSAEREIFFSKGQPCMRASALPKRYGWGVHSNSDGKIAIYAVESNQYQTFLHDQSVKKLKAMRSGRP
jgi:hypothetical protein